jgi:DNA-directed RNA polymerase specialized sigma24 family protein
MPRKTEVRKCQQCGGEFTATKKNWAKKYCNRECSDLGRRKQVRTKCRQCGVDFEFLKRSNCPDRVYCSRECVHESITKYDVDTRKEWVEGGNNRVEKLTCKYCNEEFEARPSKHRQFCSKSCASRMHADEQHGEATGEEFDHNDYVKVLNWLVRRYYIATGPIQGTDEHQSAWVGLLHACKSYRGRGKFVTHACNCMTRQIRADLGIDIEGKREVLNRTRYYPTHAKALGTSCRESGPVDAAIENELRERVRGHMSVMRPEMQNVVRCRVLKGMNNKEASDELAMMRHRTARLMAEANQKHFSGMKWIWPESCIRA